MHQFYQNTLLKPKKGNGRKDKAKQEGIGRPPPSPIRSYIVGDPIYGLNMSLTGSTDV